MKYRHVGSSPIVINEEEITSGEFDAELSPEQEAFLLHIGAIERADAPATPTTTESDSDEGQVD